MVVHLCGRELSSLADEYYSKFLVKLKQQIIRFVFIFKLFLSKCFKTLLPEAGISGMDK